MQRDQRSIEVRSQEMSCHSFILLPLKRGSRKQNSSSVFFGMLFRTSQILKKYFCSVILLTARQTVESEQEKSKRRYQVVKGWEGVRWDIFTISSGCLPLLSSLFNLFFHLFSLLDLCFSISPYANKPSTSWGAESQGEVRMGKKISKKHRGEKQKGERKRREGGKMKLGAGTNLEFFLQPARRDSTIKVSPHLNHPGSYFLTPSKTFLSVLCHLWRRWETFPWAK